LFMLVLLFQAEGGIRAGHVTGVQTCALPISAVIHFSLGLWALYQRRHFRYTAAEITQLLLGLSIPLWLASHFGAVRLGGLLFGRSEERRVGKEWGVRGCVDQGRNKRRVL